MQKENPNPSPKNVKFGFIQYGSPSWTRTNDPAVNSRMLYRLSYRGISFSIVILVYPNENVNCFCGFFGEVADFFIFFCGGRRI